MPQLVKKGAEADIFVREWAGKKVISKVRSPKQYRHKALDAVIRKHRTIHEANFKSAAKAAGVRSPIFHFADPVKD